MLRKCLVVGVCLLVASTAAPQDRRETTDNVLVWYDFEDDGIETGPYTLSIFEGAKGWVSLSNNFHYSGYRSVEVRESAGDGVFSELQGFFTDKWHGRLYAHFAVLVAEPKEAINIAFAGISHFTMREHGIGFWLRSKNGTFFQVTGGRDEPLFEIDPFVWYVVDFVYDVDQGTYDLVIHAEGQEEPIVVLRDQVNAVGIPGSSLRKYSFVGDPPGLDQSNAWYYVDDILITSDVPVADTPFVAPGRRMLFVDLFDRYRAKLYEQPGCVPVLGYEDFGFSPSDLSELSTFGGARLLGRLLDEDDVTLPPTASSFLETRIAALRDWRDGCQEKGDAVELFRRAQRKVPEGKIYAMSEVLALVGAKRYAEADELLVSIYSQWEEDPRFPAVSASIGLARSDLDFAEQWLTSADGQIPRYLSDPLVRKLWSGDIGPSTVAELRAAYPSEWSEIVRAALTAELRFYVFLWQRRYDAALGYAGRMAELHRRMELPVGRWRERQGDAAFYAGDYLEAKRWYEASLGDHERPDGIFLKLSDVYFQLGDLELERVYRERIYGSLRPE
jgi:tetratricopeptide (TPR) repeat protein